MLRFSLSPSKYLDTGDLRVALMNYITARQRGEGFVLRIEDAGNECDTTAKENETQEILKKFSIEADMVIRQSERLSLYQKLAYRLLSDKKAFICTCTAEELKAEKEKRAYRYSGKCSGMSGDKIEELEKNSIPYTVRIHKPKNNISFIDRVKGQTDTEADEIDSFKILEADGTPTYDFACACDDMSGGITMVIRDEKYLSDTAKQIHIMRSMGYDDIPEYAHLPAILNGNGGKQDFAYSIRNLLEEGYIPDAILNCLLLAGNSTPAEIFKMPDAAKWLSMDGVSPLPSYLDMDRLGQVNRAHLGTMDNKKLSAIFGFADADIGRLAKLFLSENFTVKKLETKIKSVFSKKRCSGKLKDEMQAISGAILESFPAADFETFKNTISEKTGLDSKRLARPLRMLIAGEEDGPELSDIYPLIKSYITEVARCQS